jgi:uncharacterized membrane protein
MKRLFSLLLVFGVIFAFSASVVRAQGERIDAFDVRIAVGEDGIFGVREIIHYNFDDFERHGIFRDIPYIKTNESGKRFALEFTDLRVTDGRGSAYQFEKSKEDGNIRLKIGDPDKTITGAHTYDIGYSVGGGLTYFSDHDELYWNAIGTNWEIPIDAAAIEVTLPTRVDAKDIRVACFTGPARGEESDCTEKVVNGNTVEVVATRPLESYEGLTVVVGFPKGIVATLEPVQIDAYKDTWWWKALVFIATVIILVVAILWYVVSPFYFIYKWYRYGRDPKPAIGEARAWFSQPTGRGRRLLTPGETGTLIDETAGMHEIVATIVDLAHRGYLTIEERTDGDFYLHKKSDSVAELRPHERTFMEDIFVGKKEVQVKKASWIAPVAKMKKQLYEAAVSEGFFDQNPETQRNKYYALGAVALITFNLPLAVVAFVFGSAMPAKTPVGAQAAAVARSLRNFLISQEKKLAFQAKHKMLFEKLLPFATAFGVELVWAKRFARINVPQPSWYQGTSSTRFNTYVFTRSFHNSFATSVAHAATPTSSSSGFSSGFSGGSSGGGGGGGGGGSW